MKKNTKHNSDNSGDSLGVIVERIFVWFCCSFTGAMIGTLLAHWAGFI